MNARHWQYTRQHRLVLFLNELVQPATSAKYLTCFIVSDYFLVVCICSNGYLRTCQFAVRDLFRIQLVDVAFDIWVVCLWLKLAPDSVRQHGSADRFL